MRARGEGRRVIVGMLDVIRLASERRSGVFRWVDAAVTKRQRVALQSGTVRHSSREGTRARGVLLRLSRTPRGRAGRNSKSLERQGFRDRRLVAGARFARLSTRILRIVLSRRALNQIQNWGTVPLARRRFARAHRLRFGARFARSAGDRSRGVRANRSRPPRQRARGRRARCRPTGGALDHDASTMPVGS